MDKMLKFSDKVIMAVYTLLRYTLHDVIVFPTKDMIVYAKYAGSITLISFISWFFELPTFLDWRGGLLATLIILAIYYFSERSDSNEEH